MFTPLREAAFFSRHQFVPLFQIALLYTLPSLALELTLGAGEGRPDATTGAMVNGLFLCLGVLQFGAAILYIDAKVQGRPLSPAEAIGQALQRLGGLLITNLLMGVAIGGGLMLLIVPGLFFAYKLVFAELFLLLRRENPVEALKSSYRATEGLAGDVLPPLLVWAGLVATVSIMSLAGSTEAASGPLAVIIQHLLMAGLNIWGWALIYRLYQQYVVEPATLPGEPRE
ncbi:YciC family protein [Motiliproteus sp. SC1-56]|uniref:YciC family protein n=1 Tax=Motiliproteus sp. SC1-56 TaxID=2799565 RepID=UPI001A8CA02E|nr:YciC family protein [Motiliproteus sp. SC1-56]